MIENPQKEHKVLGSAIRSRRVALGKTQLETAEGAGISQQTLSNYERTGIMPTDKLEAIATTLRTTPQKLYDMADQLREGADE